MRIIYILLLLLSNTIFSQQIDKKLPIDPETLCEIRYEFYPNYSGYYDRKKEIFLILENGIWVEKKIIPKGYRGYSIYNNVYYIITNYDEDDIIKLYPYHSKIYPYVNRKTNLRKSE